MKFIHIWQSNKDDDLQPYSKLIDKPNDEIFESIKLFVLDKRKRKRSTASMNVPLAALKLFYETNDVETIHWRRLHRFMGEHTEEHEDRAYTREEIEILLKFSDLRLEATILLEVSAGLRIGAFNTLLMSHLEKKEDCFKINVYKGLNGTGKYYTFCTPECRKALETYFQFREQYGEVLTHDSPFRKEFNTEIPNSAKTKNINDITLTSDALGRDIWKCLIKAGLRIVDHTNLFNRKEVKLSHGFRKFFDSGLIKAGIHPYLITRFIGHSAKGLDQRYARLTEDEMFIEYKKAIPFLTIDPKLQLQKTIVEQQEKLGEIPLMKLEQKKFFAEIINEFDVRLATFKRKI